LKTKVWLRCCKCDHYSSEKSCRSRHVILQWSNTCVNPHRTGMPDIARGANKRCTGSATGEDVGRSELSLCCLALPQPCLRYRGDNAWDNNTELGKFIVCESWLVTALLGSWLHPHPSASTFLLSLSSPLSNPFPFPLPPTPSWQLHM
jgi:hypothetical protein